jgi:hypothetical protein
MNLKPTKPAVQISDHDASADRKRKILITDKCRFEMAREKGEPFRVDRCKCIEGRSGCLCQLEVMSAKKF